jgi:hypothetical protein
MAAQSVEKTKEIYEGGETKYLMPHIGDGDLCQGL